MCLIKSKNRKTALFTPSGKGYLLPMKYTQHHLATERTAAAALPALLRRICQKQHTKNRQTPSIHQYERGVLCPT
jgi:hypothetical protein